MTNKPETQLDKFRDIARERKCDEDVAAFEGKMRRVATAPKPEPEPK